MSGKDKRLTFEQDFICGGFAGVLSRSLTAPLDVVKILAQVGTSSTRDGFFGTFRTVYRQEGLKAFWKGNYIACLRLFPYSGIQFATNSYCRVLFSDENGRLTPQASFAGGSISGCVATIATYPADTIKTRLTIQHGANPDLLKYKGIIHCFQTVYREEGVAALYRGTLTAIAGQIPFSGCMFMTYELLNGVWGKPKNELNGWQSFTNGCVAAAIAQTFTFPFDTIKKKMQAQAMSKDGKLDAKLAVGDVQFNGMIDCVKKTVKLHGIAGLWKGTTANLAKLAPYAGFMFWGFETAKRQFLYHNGYTISPWSENHIPGVDQKLTPSELKRVRELNATPVSHVDPTVTTARAQ